MDKQLIWRERGVGILKVNRSIADPPVSRLIMRSESVHRVILNAKIFKQMSAEIAQDKFVRIGVVGENNAIVRYAIRCKNRDLAQQLYDAIDEARLMTAVE
ncbi:hypothetical protein IWQ60_010962 [Tieghemiomyces parasiticus]|uniref:RanBD1 domain-containing protein n=1 Tax=Tieghemiomyces parasiticus TaxID=78921 RepID=A0A9W7ZP96_9FUNG|nr:hypothetical protein IWQ60_010962 [Tieghemiomyces parasiticus]